MDTSMGAAVCRICMCGETSIPYLGKQAGEPLISPCRCSGTMGLYHRSCLEHWLTLTKTKNCEICKFAFKISQRSRSFVDYIRQRGYEKLRSDSENRNPFVDFSFILVITPLACVALYLCIRGAALAGQKYHFAFENRENDENGRNLEIRNETSMEFALFVFVAVVLFFAYSIFLLVTLFNHVKQYKTWQKKNMMMFVIDQLDAEQSMHYNPQWSKRSLGWKGKLARAWKKVNRKSSSGLTPEIARNAIPIETIVGISPALVANFNQTAPDSDNTHNHDASRNAIPFGVRTPDQMLERSSTPEMYGEKPRVLNLSPIGPDDLFAESPYPSRGPSVSSAHVAMRKTQSVYSVCSSFGNGVVTCSTPRVRSLNPLTSVSTFKSPSRMSSDGAPEDVQNTIVAADVQMGRFHVERLDTPRF